MQGWKWYIGGIHGFGDCVFYAEDPFANAFFRFQKLTKVVIHPQTGQVGFAPYSLCSEKFATGYEGTMNASTVMYLFEASNTVAEKVNEIWSKPLGGGNGIVVANQVPDFKRIK